MEKTTETTEPIKKVSALKAEKFKENPFLEAKAYDLAKNSKTKRVTNKEGGVLVHPTTGEITANIAGFWVAEEVDSSKFVKLFVNGVKAFSNLTTAGAKTFEYVYYEIQRNIGKDKIYLNHNVITEDSKLRKATFYKGLSELIEKKFLAPTTLTGWYWINPDFVFNGDRLSFVKTYIKKKAEDTQIQLFLEEGEE